ncbi:MAG: YlmH/Sll1252 family protein [Defluviitaleaceae bacterium]|nr:YlmH/Sll1252 family protein [Defluviitaleaceae bacterium]
MHSNNNNLIKNTISKVLDQVSFYSHEPSFSYFIDRNLAEIAVKLVKKEYKKLNFKISGGIEGLERVIIGVSEKKVEEKDFPIIAVKFVYDKYGRVNHREILGTILGNGIDRNRIGDILIFEDYCIVFTLKSLKDAIVSIDRIGKYNVSAEITDSRDLFIPLQNYIEKTISRTDAKLTSIIASAFNISKTSAKELLKNKKIKINGLEVKKEANLNEKSSITVRGFGRITIQEIGDNIKLHIYG